MIFIPIHNHAERWTALIVVIEADNLERMKKADPITLESKSKGGLMPVLPYPSNTSLLIAYEEDAGPIYEMAQKHDVVGIVKHLERNRRFIEGLDGTQFARAFTEAKQA
jgi:hypothetical protein